MVQTITSSLLTLTLFLAGDLTKELFEDEDDLYVLCAGAVFAF